MNKLLQASLVATLMSAGSTALYAEGDTASRPSYNHRYLHILMYLMQLLRFHSVHLLNILRAVEECSVKSKVLPILQVHFPTYLSSAVGLKEEPS